MSFQKIAILFNEMVRKLTTNQLLTFDSLMNIINLMKGLQKCERRGSLHMGISRPTVF